MLVSIGRLAEFFGVSVVTIRRWEREGRIEKGTRTLGNHRRFELKDYQAEETQTTTVLYARVSSHDQANDLNTQIGGVIEILPRF